MKKEYYWFFMFILAAALVTGSTMSIYTNFKYISQQSKLNQQQSSQTEKQSTSVNQAAQQPTVTSKSASTVDQKLADNGTSSSNAMIISQDEQEEINAMLSAMGSESQDYSLRIKEFQQKNSLPVTGIMDTDTLNLLINKATIQKAVQHINN